MMMVPTILTTWLNRLWYVQKIQFINIKEDYLPNHSIIQANPVLVILSSSSIWNNDLAIGQTARLRLKARIPLATQCEFRTKNCKKWATVVGNHLVFIVHVNVFVIWFVCWFVCHGIWSVGRSVSRGVRGKSRFWFIQGGVLIWTEMGSFQIWTESLLRWSSDKSARVFFTFGFLFFLAKYIPMNSTRMYQIVRNTKGFMNASLILSCRPVCLGYT